jgi:hypothetical protein
MNRTGKIARLPYFTRQELNRRLLDNEPGDTLVSWLNAQPQVQAVLNEQFGGKPITQQNLSEWRTGGFAVWELRQNVLGDAQEAEETSDELDAVTKSRLADQLMTLLTGRYASLLVHWDGEITPALAQKLRALHGLCRDLNVLRRAARAPRSHGVATARRHTEPPTPKNAPSPVRHSSPGDDGSDPVAPSRTIFQSNTERGTPAEVAASCGHTRTQAPGNTVGAAPAAILHSSICLPHSPAKSDPVAPGRTTFPSKSGTNASADVATSGRHPGPGTGKEDGRMKNEELGKGHGTTDQSKAVAPGRTTLTSDIVMSALAELARSGRHPEPAGKPLPGMPNSLLSKALQAAREQNRPGQPVLTVLPDFDEAVRLGQPAISSCRQ